MKKNTVIKKFHVWWIICIVKKEWNLSDDDPDMTKFKIYINFQIIFLILTPFVLSLDGLTNYSTEDGNERTETIDNEGNVRGQYSYNGPHGKRIKVKYTAGKKGFQVILIKKSLNLFFC